MKKTITPWVTIFFILLYLPAAWAGQADKAKKKGDDAIKNGACITYPVHPMPPIHYGRFLLDRLEYALSGQEKKSISFEATAWYGGDYRRVWLEAEGQHDSGGGDGGEIDKLDLLYGQLISPFWNLRAGLGYAGTYGPDSDERFFAVMGLKGLSPYFFELDTNLRISNRGEVLLDFEAEYDFLITQRLILQPRLDATYSFNKIEARDIGPGFPIIAFGARLRYEIRSEFAPYIGIEWTTRTGKSSDLARQNGEPRDVTKAMVGIRMWF